MYTEYRPLNSIIRTIQPGFQPWKATLALVRVAADVVTLAAIPKLQVFQKY
jgi:hypothetical protein